MNQIQYIERSKFGKGKKDEKVNNNKWRDKLNWERGEERWSKGKGVLCIQPVCVIVPFCLTLGVGMVGGLINDTF